MKSNRSTTDYYHRRKMLSSKYNLLRVNFGKKNNYFYCSFINTPDLRKPDRCYGYFESRWIVSDQPLKMNVTTAQIFGALLREKLKETHLKLKTDKVILDLGRRKKLLSGKRFFNSLMENKNYVPLYNVKNFDIKNYKFNDMARS